MIALFATTEAAQAYCDARSAALGCPITGTHPRSGAVRIIMARWDEPRPHPSNDGRAWCAVDPSGPEPSGAVIVETLPESWKEENP